MISSKGQSIYGMIIKPYRYLLSLEYFNPLIYIPNQKVEIMTVLVIFFIYLKIQRN